MIEKKHIKVALVNPPPLPGVFHHQPVPPIGLAYLAAVLERDGHEVKVLDCPLLNINYEELGHQLSNFKPDMTGITTMTRTVQSALKVARVSKEHCPGATTVLGGPHVTFTAEEVLSKHLDVDIVVRREGELTILALAHHIAAKREICDVLGITYREKGKISSTADRPLIQDLDQLPYPAYHLFPLERYRIFGKRILPVMTSRGCPFQCSFCVTSKMVGKKFRARSPENVVSELEWLKDVHGADAYCFYDDTLTLNKKRAYKIFEGMRKRRIDLPWDCQTRADQISRETLEKMREAGCQLVSFGVESGCQRILNAVGKGTTVKQNERAVKLAKEAGLLVAVSVIIGYPGETIDTIKQTLDFIWKVKPDDAYLCVATPYPGTDLYNQINDLGWELSADWSHYDTMAPVFENPSLPTEAIIQSRRKFYDRYYSPFYIISHLLRNRFYSRIMARTAMNHLLWRIKTASFL